MRPSPSVMTTETGLLPSAAPNTLKRSSAALTPRHQGAHVLQQRQLPLAAGVAPIDLAALHCVVHPVDDNLARIRREGQRRSQALVAVVAKLARSADRINARLRERRRHRKQPLGPR